MAWVLVFTKDSLVLMFASAKEIVVAYHREPRMLQSVEFLGHPSVFFAQTEIGQVATMEHEVQFRMIVQEIDSFPRIVVVALGVGDESKPECVASYSQLLNNLCILLCQLHWHIIHILVWMIPEKVAACHQCQT